MGQRLPQLVMTSPTRCATAVPRLSLMALTSDCWDGRDPSGIEVDVHYQPRVIGNLDDSYELIPANVRHDQISGLPPVLAGAAGGADVLFFNNLWTTVEPIGCQLGRSRHFCGFPVAGGRWDGNRLDAALLGEVRLSEIDGSYTVRGRHIPTSFAGCRMSVDFGADILARLWVHFAIEAGVIGSVIAAGDVDAFPDNLEHLQRAVLGVRDALEVVRAREIDIDIDARPDAKLCFGPEGDVADVIRAEYESNWVTRKVTQHHTEEEGCTRIYHDVLGFGSGPSVPVCGRCSAARLGARHRWRQPSWQGWSCCSPSWSPWWRSTRSRLCKLGSRSTGPAPAPRTGVCPHHPRPAQRGLRGHDPGRGGPLGRHVD